MYVFCFFTFDLYKKKKVFMSAAVFFKNAVRVRVARLSDARPKKILFRSRLPLPLPLVVHHPRSEASLGPELSSS